MEATLIATRSIARAAAEHIQAVLVSPGHYRSASKSQRGVWYDQRAERRGEHVIVTCSCPGGTAFKDELGNSLDKHAIAVAKRLLRTPRELANLPRPAASARITYAAVRATRRQEVDF